MAGEKPYFSIIIPVYNRPDEVRELLESLVGQTCKDFELLLVEDGSTCRCDEVAGEYSDRLTIRYFYKENSVYNIGTVVNIRRKMLRMTMKELYEGVCSEKTLRNLEHNRAGTHRDIAEELLGSCLLYTSPSPRDA